MHFDLNTFKELIQSFGVWGGYLIIWGIIFAESGLMVGFFLPGDSLLFTAGIVASQNILNIEILLVGAFLSAVLGDNVGYLTGNRFGKRLFSREDSMFFKKKHLRKAEVFYEQYGKKTIVLARFLPIIRTFAPIVAGIASMNYRWFVLYNLVGGFLWTVGLTLLGFFLGRIIPANQVDHYLLPIIALIIVVSVLPSIAHLRGDKSPKAPD